MLKIFRSGHADTTLLQKIKEQLSIIGFGEGQPLCWDPGGWEGRTGKSSLDGGRQGGQFSRQVECVRRTGVRRHWWRGS